MIRPKQGAGAMKYKQENKKCDGYESYEEMLEKEEGRSN